MALEFDIVESYIPTCDDKVGIMTTPSKQVQSVLPNIMKHIHMMQSWF